MSAPDITTPIRAAIVGQSGVTDKLGDYLGGPAVHTRRPVDPASEYPLTIVSTVTVSDEDGITQPRPVVAVDITTYGTQGAPGAPEDQYRDVEAVAYLLRDLFHRQRKAITVPGWSVTDIRATGPFPAPADDETHVARRVTLQVRLSQ